MILIDTSIWIEFFRGHSPYFEMIDVLVEQNSVVTIAPVFGELFQGAKNERERDILDKYWNNIPKPIVHNLLIQAGLESSRKHWLDKGVGLIDAAIIYTARQKKFEIWSLDKKLNSLLKKSEKYSS